MDTTIDITIDTTNKTSDFSKNIEDYYLEDNLGSGAFGSVFKATYNDNNNGNQKICAIKKMNIYQFFKRIPRYLIDQDKDRYINSLKESVTREVSTLEHLSRNGCNENILCYYQLFYDDETNAFYIVTEYIEGYDLSYYYQRKMDPIEMIRFLRDILNALNFIHSKGILHRDVKAKNIVYDVNSKKYKLIDFGLICYLEGDHVDDFPCIRFVGSPVYAPRGIYKNKDKSKFIDLHSRHVDIFSLSITLLELITGDEWVVYKVSELENYPEFILGSQTPTELLRYRIYDLSLRMREDKNLTVPDILESQEFKDLVMELPEEKDQLEHLRRLDEYKRERDQRIKNTQYHGSLNKSMPVIHNLPDEENVLASSYSGGKNNSDDIFYDKYINQKSIYTTLKNKLIEFLQI